MDALERNRRLLLLGQSTAREGLTAGIAVEGTQLGADMVGPYNVEASSVIAHAQSYGEWLPIKFLWDHCEKSYVMFEIFDHEMIEIHNEEEVDYGVTHTEIYHKKVRTRRDLE